MARDEAGEVLERPVGEYELSHATGDELQSMVSRGKTGW